MRITLAAIALLAAVQAPAQLTVTWDRPANDTATSWDVWSAIGSGAPRSVGITRDNRFTFTQAPDKDTLILAFGVSSNGYYSPPAVLSWRPSPGNIGVVTRTNWVNVTNYVSVATNLPPLVPVATRLVNGDFAVGLTGWSVSGNVDNGYASLRFNAGNKAPNGIAAQAVPTVVGKTYTLTFDAGIIAFLTRDPATGAFRKWPQAIAVAAKGVNLDVGRTVNLTPPATEALTWSPQTLRFTADSGLTAITFRDVSPGTDSSDCLVDNVTIR